jgi:hypothetical protein
MSTVVKFLKWEKPLLLTQFGNGPTYFDRGVPAGKTMGYAIQASKTRLRYFFAILL